MTKSDIIKVLAGIILIVGLIGTCIIEYPFIVNTFEMGKLFMYAFCAAFLMAIVLSFKFIQSGESLFDKFVMSMGALVILLMLTPILMSNLNRNLGDESSSQERFDLIDFGARSSQMYGVLDSTAVKADGYRINVQVEGEKESFLLKNREAFRVKDKHVFLPVKKGFFGFKYVDED